MHKYFLLVMVFATSVFAGPAALLGKWQSNDEKSLIIFAPDSRVISFTGPITRTGHYECYGENRLCLKFEDEGALPPLELKYEVKGDLLKIENAQEKVTEFRKLENQTMRIIVSNSTSVSRRSRRSSGKARRRGPAKPGGTNTDVDNSPEADAKSLGPLLRGGDLIFIRISNPLYRRVAATSLSWESHVGLAFPDTDGKWSVAESTFPLSKFTPLEKFISRSENHRFLVRRCREDLSVRDRDRLRRAAEARTGRFYHLGFNYDSHRMLYCSKFVYDVYKEATGREVGRIETFRQLLTANPAAPLGFWRMWFLGRIPWDRRCITTTSEIEAENLVTVFDSEAGERLET